MCAGEPGSPLRKLKQPGASDFLRDARESVEPVLSEMLTWFDQHVKHAK
jgi:hypothetical protein